MFRFFKSEFKRMLKSRYLLLGCLVSFIGLFIDFVHKLKIYFQGIDLDTSIFEKWIGIESVNIGALIFYWLLPLSVSIPFAWTMRDEMNSGYTGQMLTRVKKRNYFFTKFLVSFLSGAIIAAVSLLISLWASSFILMALYPQPNDGLSGVYPKILLSKLYYTNPYLYVLIWILVAALWCGVIAGLCYSLSFFIRRKTVIIISVQIIFIFQDMIAHSDIFMSRYHYSLPWFKSWFQLGYATGSNYSPAIFINMSILLAIELLIIAVMGKRYENI